MDRDPVYTSLLEGLSDSGRQNIALLLDRLDARLRYQIDLLKTQLSGRIGKHESGSADREARLKKLEHCPCAVHRDPAHSCVVLDTDATLARIEAKVDAKLSPLKLRLAYIVGGLGVLVFLLDLAVRLLPFYWR